MESGKFPHDAAYKAIFSYPQMVESLLVDFVPEGFISGFDFQTLEPLRDSFIEPGFEQRHDDIIWRIKWRGQDCFICILLEFQSTQDALMALRFNLYFSLLWQGLIKHGVLKEYHKLPMVFPIVLYNGDAPWKAPLTLRDCIKSLHAGLDPYQPDLRYFVLDEKHVSKPILESAKGGASYVFRTEQAHNGQAIYDLG